jgi:hypothetical protein
MIEQLKIEWLKIKNYRAFIVLSIFFLLGIAATNYIVYSVFKNVVKKSEAGLLLNDFNPYQFEYVWQTTSYTTGYLLLLPVMLLIMLTTNEYAFRTNRQNIIDGWERSDFANVKLILAFIVALLSAFFVMMVALVFGYTTGHSFSWNGFSHVGYFFIKALTYNLFAVLLSVLIKRTGFAMGLFFIYLGAENIVSQLLDVFSLHLKSNNHLDLGSIGDYLPMNASDGLLTFPKSPIKSLATNLLPTEYTAVVMVFACIYIAMMIWLIKRIIMKKDL